MSQVLGKTGHVPPHRGRQRSLQGEQVAAPDRSFPPTLIPAAAASTTLLLALLTLRSFRPNRSPMIATTPFGNKLIIGNSLGYAIPQIGYSRVPAFPG